MAALSIVYCGFLFIISQKFSKIFVNFKNLSNQSCHFLVAMRSQSFDNLIETLTNPSCTLIQLLQQDNLIQAIQNKCEHLTKYLIDHIPEFFDIVFDNASNYPEALKKRARQCLMSRLSLINPDVLDQILDRLVRFIDQDSNVADFALISFTKIFYYLITNTNYGILDKYEITNNITVKLLKRICHPAVMDLLTNLTSDRGQHATNFIKKDKALESLLGLIEREGLAAQYAIELIRNIIANQENEGEWGMDVFADPAIFSHVFTLARSNNHAISSTAFQIINSVLKTYMFSDEKSRSENEIYNTTMPIIIENIPKIVDCIVSAPIYQFYCDPAHMLLINISKMGYNVTSELITVLKYIFNQMITYPNNSKVHCAFLTSLRSVEKLIDEQAFYELINEFKLRENIINQFKSPNFSVNRAYYLEFAELINKKDNLNGRTATPDWVDFINNVYKPYKATIIVPYGGKIQFDNDSYEEEPDSDESIKLDEFAIQDAINLFGKDYIFDACAEDMDGCECDDFEFDMDNEEEFM